MSTLRDSGSTRLSLPAAGAAAGARDEFLEAVRAAAAGDFDVLGEIGRVPGGAIAYLARDLASGKLVALSLTGGSSGSEYLLDVANRLDSNLPAPPSTCAHCNAPVRGWNRFCTQCGVDLWSDQSLGDRWTKQDLLEAVKQASRGKFEILGEMNRSEGGGVVYFARDLETGKIEALRLQTDREGDYSIGLTGVLNRFAAPISSHRSPRGAP